MTSPTAELLFKNHSAHSAKSAGTSDKARIKVNQKLIDWADIIFLRELKHRLILEQRISDELTSKHVVVLDIEDNYQFNDPELVISLQASLQDYL